MLFKCRDEYFKLNSVEFGNVSTAEDHEPSSLLKQIPSNLWGQTDFGIVNVQGCCL